MFLLACSCTQSASTNMRFACFLQRCCQHVPQIVQVDVALRSTTVLQLRSHVLQLHLANTGRLTWRPERRAHLVVVCYQAGTEARLLL
jgi:hypothetical protein